MINLGKSETEPSGANIGSFFKKPRTEEVPTSSIITEDELRALPYEQLLDAAVELRKALATAVAQPPVVLMTAPVLQESTGNRQLPQAGAAEWTPERIGEKARQMRELCTNGVKRQMKWQPSCKKGSTKWSYEGHRTQSRGFLPHLRIRFQRQILQTEEDSRGRLGPPARLYQRVLPL
jgi:hypothetical protein